jgi:signal transduction histidine kinase
LKNIGIRTKIISITLLFLGVGLFIAPGVLVDIAELRFKQVIEEGSDKLVEELKEDYQNLEPLESQRFIPYFVLVYDKQNGKLISEYSFFPPNLIDDYDPQSNQFSENLTDLNFIKTESNDKKVDIVVGFSESTPSEIINGIERIFIVIYILASLLVIVGILISIQIALKPVDKSIKKIEKLDPLNKLEKLDEVASNDEIGNLISTFNSLLEKVNISSISQKQFISNASHELKTPLTSLKLQIEKLSVLNGVDEEMIKNIQEDINEIQSTLEALLDLETLGSNTESSEEVLVNDLIKGVVVGTDVIFQDKKEIKIFSNSNVIKLMLNNLIGNAEKFKSNKTVISTDFVHGIPSVIVEDDGGGIKPENYDLIFTPFWQEDESRTRNKGGKGIGLSIVKNITLKYGWTISVDKSELGGAKFIISF